MPGQDGKDKAAAATVDLVDPSTSTNIQQAEIAARLAKEKASAAALERQQAYENGPCPPRRGKGGHGAEDCAAARQP